MEEYHKMVHSMDPDLYRAVVHGDILEFFTQMEKESIPRPALCLQLTPQRNTVLHLATILRHDEIVKVLCKDLPFLAREKNSRGDTPLHIAARAGDPLLVSLLLACGESGLGEVNNEGNSALHEALQQRHGDVARMLIDEDRNMAYSVNKERKAVLQLAAEAGFADIVKLLMENPVGNYGSDEKLGYNSPAHSAISGRNLDVLKILWNKDESCFHQRCEKGRTPLHIAAYLNYAEGVRFLLDVFHISAYQMDKYGYYPIHLAAKNGHTDVIREMLGQRLDMMELLNLQGQNIIHAAAKAGQGKAIGHLLKVAELSQLINARDENGNTPLHLATIYGHSEAVNILANDQRINLSLVNHKGCTALDIADEQMEANASFQKRLTWMALRVVGTPRSPQPRMFRIRKELLAQKDGISNESHNAKVNIILLVATLVATVTFSAGFTVPGGNKNSSGGEGLATMISKGYFHAFVICDAVALYSSIIMAVTLILAQFGDSSSVRIALKFAFPLLGVALLMMSVAFMAGLYLVISELHWLAQFVSTLGVIIVTTLLALFALVCLPSPNFLIVRRIIYYPLCLLLFALGDNK